MTESNKGKDNGRPRENLFQIMDGIIYELSRTKKIFITLIVAHLIIVPLAFAVTFALFGPPFPIDGRWQPNEFGSGFGIGRFIPVLVVLIWLGVGIRQWLALSRWTKRYERYKELQKKIDAELDYDRDEK